MILRDWYRVFITLKEAMSTSSMREMLRGIPLLASRNLRIIVMKICVQFIILLIDIVRTVNVWHISGTMVVKQMKSMFAWFMFQMENFSNAGKVSLILGGKKLNLLAFIASLKCCRCIMSI